MEFTSLMGDTFPVKRERTGKSKRPNRLASADLGPERTGLNHEPHESHE